MTNHWRGVLDGAMLTRCEEVSEVCADLGADPAEFNGERDHVHLLVEYPPKMAASVHVNSLNGVSSRGLRQDLTGRVNGPPCTAASGRPATSPHPAAVRR